MFSAKGRYALRLMVDLAEHNDQGHVPLKSIAERQGLSKKYMEIIVKELVKGGMIVGVSGKGGGYNLCRKPEEYTVGEILELMEGSFDSVSCLAKGAKKCPRASVCTTVAMWKEYDKVARDFFYGKKLSDLLPSEADAE